MPTAVDDKEAIRELLAEYCFRLDDGRFAEMAALFTEDGTWDTAFGKAVGPAAIAALAQSLRERAGAARHQYRHRARWRSGPGALELDGHREQRRRTENRLGRRLSRRHREGGRALALPLPQDRPLYRRVSSGAASVAARDARAVGATGVNETTRCRGPGCKSSLSLWTDSFSLT